MFHVVTGANRDRYARQLKSMHAHRPEMFEGRPGGGPEAAAGRGGRDRFDDVHAIYVMGLDSFGEIECCVRLRPGNQGSIVGSFYTHGINPNERPPNDPLTWEMSHYYARGGARGEAGHGLRAQMRLAVLAAADAAGIDRILSVAELAFWPAAQRCGWTARRVGPDFYYCEDAKAVVYEVAAGPEALEAYRRWLERDVAEAGPEAGEVAAVADRLGPKGLDLVSSLTRRIAGIEETDGPDAALALVEKLNRAAGEAADS